MSEIDAGFDLGASGTGGATFANAVRRTPLLSLTLDRTGRVLAACGEGLADLRTSGVARVGACLHELAVALPWLVAGFERSLLGECCSAQGAFGASYYQAQFCPQPAGLGQELISRSSYPPAPAAGDAALISAMISDISQLQQAADVRFFLESVFEYLPNMVFVKDATDLRLVRLNKAGEELLGRARSELVGRNDVDNFPLDEAAFFANKDREVLASGRMVDIPCEPVHTQKGVRYLHTKKIPLYDHAGRPAYLLGISEDISDLRRLEQERLDLLLREQEARLAAQQAQSQRTQEQEARLEAERLSLLKDQFLATLSHELRTPLSAILGWSQLLQSDGLDSATHQQGLRTIERNARIETQLVEDLLDISQIVTGKMRLDVQFVSLATVVENALGTVRLAAQAKGVGLHFQFAADARTDIGSGLVRGDARRLTQVVWNLLSNAIKFTAKGGAVWITLGRTADSYQLTVRDTGIGIKAEFCEHVFERFRQADSSLTRGYGGLGIGLAIVRELVQLHGGTVRVESAGEGLGASFHVELPVLTANNQREAVLIEADLGNLLPLEAILGRSEPSSGSR